jgi:hypothetical protein
VFKRIVVLCLALALGFWFFQSIVENDKLREKRQVENQRIFDEIKSNVTKLKEKFGANSQWVESLSKGESYRFKPILSIELEKVWNKDKPIIFLGSLNDIATIDESNYQVTLERGLWSGLDTMFSTKLRLSLVANKDLIDTFLAKHPDLLENFGLNNGIALAAKISEIESSQITDSEGTITEVKTGKGVLLGLVFTGDARL